MARRQRYTVPRTGDGGMAPIPGLALSSPPPPSSRANWEVELFIDGETRASYTYAQLKSTALEFGKGLKSQWQWKKGDTLGIFSPNTIDYAPAIFGTLWAGGVASTANPTYTVKELAFQMKDSNAKAILTQVPMLAAAREAAKLVGIPEDRIILMGADRDPSGRFKHFTEIRSTGLLGFHSQTRVEPSKDLAFLVYSSGTTGLPKGVMLTHGNIVANVMQFSAAERRSGLHCMGGLDRKGDKQLAVLPFFHVYVSESRESAVGGEC